MPKKAAKKKVQDKIVTAEMNSLLWQLYESHDVKQRLYIAADLLAVYGLIPDIPYSKEEWYRKGLN